MLRVLEAVGAGQAWEEASAAGTPNKTRLRPTRGKTTCGIGHPAHRKPTLSLPRADSASGIVAIHILSEAGAEGGDIATCNGVYLDKRQFAEKYA